MNCPRCGGIRTIHKDADQIVLEAVEYGRILRCRCGFTGNREDFKGS